MKNHIGFHFPVLALAAILSVAGPSARSADSPKVRTLVRLYQADFFGKSSQEVVAVLDQGKSVDFLTCGMNSMPPNSDQLAAYLSGCEGIGTFSEHPDDATEMRMRLVHQSRADRFVVIVTGISAVSGVSSAEAMSMTFTYTRKDADHFDTMWSNMRAFDGENPIFETKRVSGLKIREAVLELPRIAFKPIEQ